MKKINKYFEYGDKKPKYLVVLLHGYGSSGKDLIDLAPVLSRGVPKACFVSPNAPMDSPNPFMAGYQWFELGSRDPEVMHPQIIQSNDKLDVFIGDQLERFNLEYKDLILVGFSQGAMMSLYNSMRSVNDIAGVVAFSGRLISPQATGDEVRSKPNICLIHGFDDDVVPFEHFIKAKEDLEILECQFEAHKIDDLGHSINLPALGKAREFLKKITN
jgi:phospholipase/carboxylesterase